MTEKYLLTMHQHFCPHRVMVTQHKYDTGVMLVSSIIPYLVVYNARGNTA